jgi:hypothetical protein
MRRSAARNMVRRGIGIGEIKKLAGWKPDSMFNRYNVIDNRDLQDATARPEGVSGDLKATPRSY